MREINFPASFREEDTTYFIKRANSAESSFLLGLPGVGTSGFLRFLTYNKPLRERRGKDLEKTLFVLLDPNSLPEVSTFHFYRLALQQLTKTATENTNGDVKKRIKTVSNGWPEIKDSFLLLDKTKEIIYFLCEENHLKVIFIIDRFDHLHRRLDESFFNSLKSIRDTAKLHFSYLLAAPNLPSKEEPFNENLEEFLALVLPFAHHLKPLNAFDSELIIEETLKDSPFTLAEFQREEVFRLCGGHSKLTKTFLQAVKLSEAGKEWTTLIEEAGKNETTRIVLQKIWAVLEEKEKEALKKIVNEEKLEGEEEGGGDTLVKRGLLKRENGKLSLFASLFENFIRDELSRQRKAAAEKQGEKDKMPSGIYLDEDSQRVFKNGVELEQVLTRQEYALLSFFLKNDEKIISRDEVVTAVWGRAAIEGASDEAIDQLISRLRGKIEDDKSNPQHILTIRGRGFRFTSKGF